MADHDDFLALFAQTRHFDMHLVTSGQVASNTVKPRASASRRTDCGTPCALNTRIPPLAHRPDPR